MNSPAIDLKTALISSSRVEPRDEQELNPSGRTTVSVVEIMKGNLMKVVFAFVIASFGQLSESGGPSDADPVVLQAIADLADANYAKFPYGTLKIIQQDGNASSSERARAGQLDHSATVACLFKYDDKGRAFYERRYAQDVLAAATKRISPDTISSSLFSFRGVANSDSMLIERFNITNPNRPESSTSNFLVGSQGFYSLIVSPLHLGFPADKRSGLAKILNMIVRHEGSFHIDRLEVDAIREGHRAVHIALSSPDFVVDWWVDLERGGIPFYERSVYKSRLVREEFNDKIELVAGHGWLPHTKTVFTDGSAVRRITLEQADFETPLGLNDFTLTLERPTELLHPVTKARATRSKVWNLDRLPASFTRQVATPPDPASPRGTAALPVSPRPVPPGELESRPSRSPLPLAVAAGLIVLGVFGYRAWRR